MRPPAVPPRPHDTRRLRTHAGPLLVLLGLLAAAAAAEPEPAGRPALPSRLAAESLLLDVARAGDRLIAVGQRGHVVLSDDRGDTWRQAESVPVRVNLTSVHFIDAQHGWAVGHDAVVLHSADGGETWRVQHSAPELESPLLSVWLDERGRGLAVGAFSLVLETRDGGGHWSTRPPPGGEGADPHLNAIFAGPEETLWIAAERGRVYRSEDGGESWQGLETPYSGSFWNGLALPEGAILIFGLRGHAFRSSDLGEHWEPVETGTDKSLAGGVVLGPEHVVLVGLGGVVLSSRDGGRRFALRTLPHRRALTAVAPGPPGRLVLFGESGVEGVDE